VKLRLKLVAVVGVLVTATIIATAATGHDKSGINAKMTGYEELPTLSTSANGTFTASLNRAGDAISYTETYTGPFDANAAGGNVLQSHIHFGARAFSGQVSAFLCSNLGNGPAGTPTCPSPSGTVTGVITAAQVIGPAGQGISAGQFDELVAAIRAGYAYVNVHTSTFPAGEIRGQISDKGGNDESNND
jgi:CHRD domain